MAGNAMQRHKSTETPELPFRHDLYVLCDSVFGFPLRTSSPKAKKSWAACVPFYGLLWLIVLPTGCLSHSEPLAYTIGSSSMAPRLNGPTRRAHCPSCGNSFAVAAETYRAHLPTRCSNCGGACSVADKIEPGQRVRIQPIQDASAISRFDIIAFRHEAFNSPGSASTPVVNQVKRVWALPQEQVQLRVGELWVDGRLFQKTMQEFKRICVPVGRFPRDRISHWEIRQNPPSSPIGTMAIEAQATADRSGAILRSGDALEWTSRRPAPVHTEQTPADAWLQTSSIVDDYAVNQGVACNLHEVEDFLVSIEFTMPVPDVVTVECNYRNSVVPICLVGSENWPPKHSSALSSSIQSSSIQVQCANSIDIAICDGRLLIESEFESRTYYWQELIEQGLASESGQAKHATPPVVRITTNCEIAICRADVARDLYLYNVDWSANQSDESDQGYFVLGDNIPVSIDSRSGLGRVAASQLLGYLPEIDRAASKSDSRTK